MKKEIIVVIIIIILIFIGHISFQKITKSNFKEILNDLDNIEIRMSSGEKDNNNLKEEMQKLLEKWENKSNLLAVYIEHDELEKVEKELVSLQANIQTKSYAQGIEDLKKCKFIIQHIIDKEALKIVNIF